MRVLVTGSSGFIGQHLLGYLLKMGGVGQVMGASRLVSKLTEENFLVAPGNIWRGHCQVDLTSPNQVESLMAHYRPTMVFHLAANPLVKVSRSDEIDLVQSNLMATAHLLALVPDGCRFVLASSATVYGDSTTRLRPAHESSPMEPTSLYGACKCSSESLLWASSSLGRVHGLALRLGAVVGPGASHGLLPDLVRKLHSDNPRLELLGDEPGSCKPYSHVDDVVEAFIGLGFNEGISDPFNISACDSLSVLEVAQNVMAELQMHKPITWLGEIANWKGDNREVFIDPSRALKFGWSPRSICSSDAVRRAAVELNKTLKERT